ncbi:hypothetical protein KJ980_01240 [Patescibacteria group bacterium]|nr:hypothetical protein [Patescibacteria group bacterium]
MTMSFSPQPQNVRFTYSLGKSGVVLDEKAEQSLLKHFPRMRVSLLEGKQGHANPIVNKDEYNRKIREAIFDGTIIASERYIDRQKIKSS